MDVDSVSDQWYVEFELRVRSHQFTVTNTRFQACIRSLESGDRSATWASLIMNGKQNSFKDFRKGHVTSRCPVIILKSQCLTEGKLSTDRTMTPLSYVI